MTIMPVPLISAPGQSFQSHMKRTYVSCADETLDDLPGLGEELHVFI